MFATPVSNFKNWNQEKALWSHVGYLGNFLNSKYNNQNPEQASHVTVKPKPLMLLPLSSEGPNFPRHHVWGSLTYEFRGYKRLVHNNASDGALYSAHQDDCRSDINLTTGLGWGRLELKFPGILRLLLGGNHSQGRQFHTPKGYITKCVLGDNEQQMLLVLLDKNFFCNVRNCSAW